jgi:hypothetical protein
VKGGKLVSDSSDALVDMASSAAYGARGLDGQLLVLAVVVTSVVLSLVTLTLGEVVQHGHAGIMPGCRLRTRQRRAAS